MIKINPWRTIVLLGAFAACDVISYRLGKNLTKPVSIEIPGLVNETGTDIEKNTEYAYIHFNDGRVTQMKRWGLGHLIPVEDHLKAQLYVDKKLKERKNERAFSNHLANLEYMTSEAATPALPAPTNSPRANR
jgi:hypothetical protein